ncbi:MAG: uridylate kinase [uncultured bacterium]|nr:MAG: uridylate kinase [uncultured bacterium]
MKTIIISLGGSIVSTATDNAAVRQQYADWLLELAKTNVVAVIVGGGYRARQAIEQAKQQSADFTDEQLDQIGIEATRVNANVMQELCGVTGSLIIDPHVQLPKQPSLVFGAGWVPGRSTDYDAVALAIENGVKTVYNLSNVDRVYDKDPKQYPDAQPLPLDITWDQLLDIIGKDWQPGLNAPFDPIAAQLAKEYHVTVKLVRGMALFDNAGTVIHS